MLARMWRKRNTPPLLVGLQTCSNHSGSQSGGSFRKLGIVLLEDPEITLLSIHPEDIPTSNKDTCSTMFIAALFILARTRKNPDVPQQRTGYKKSDTFTQWSTTQLFKTMNL